MGGKAHFLCLGAIEDAVGVGQLAQHVVADIAAPEREAGHVGHQAPFQLHDGAARVRMDEADVRAGEDLETAAKGHAMRRRDHRGRNLAPAPGDILCAIGNAMRAVRQGVVAAGDALGILAAGLAAEAGQVQPGAEGPALAGHDHGAQALHFLELQDRLIDPVEHGGVEGVHLVGADEADVGNAVVQHGDGDPVFHGSVPDLVRFPSLECGTPPPRQAPALPHVA